MGLTSFRGTARTSGRQRRETPSASTQIAPGSLYDTISYRIVYWMLGRWRLTVKEAAELSRWVT